MRSAWLTGDPAPAAEPIDHLIRQWARSTPEAPAIVGEEGAISYRELDRRADAFATILHRRGPRWPGDVVGVLSPRSPRTVIALLGIWRAGCAYLPLDPDAPPLRRRAMLRAASSVAVVGQEEAYGLDLPVISIDAAEHPAPSPPASAADPDRPACVMFTSGTTGEPKGALITHRAVHRLAYGVPQLDDFGPGDVVPQFAPLAFDASLFEIWATLARGACVAVAPPGPLGPAEIGDTIGRYGASTAWLTSSLANEVITAKPEALGTLRHLLTGGEPLSRAHIVAAHRCHPGLRITNCYGPTESTTFATTFTTSSEPRADTPNVPIGTPLRGTDVGIVHEDGSVAVAGEVGEIWIGGSGLALGYCADSALTGQRFVPHPLHPGRLAYRTGDLGRLLADGNLDILGRNDDQIKIYGHRVEPREVEAVLLACPGVSAAAVIARDRRLVAYLVGSARDARRHVTERLPSWLVPSAFVELARLPLTANGKLDTVLLPAPVLTGDRPSIPPATEDERLLAAIVGEILGVERVSVRDDFFALGGDSFLAMRVASRAGAEGLGFPTRLLFQHPTIAALAVAARHHRASHDVPPEPPDEGGGLDSIPIIKWFLGSVTEFRNHYNQAMLLSLPDPLDRGALRAALNALVRHHEAFRLRVDGGRVEIGDFEPCDDLLLDDTTSQAVQAGLDVEKGPLLRAGIVQGRALLAVHRLAVDIASWPVVIDDLNAAYVGAAIPRRTGATLGEWARAIDGYSRSGVPLHQRAFWEEICRTPKGSPAAATGTFRDADSLSSEIPPHETEHFTKLVEAHGASLHSAVLAVVGGALCDWSARRDVLITVEDHGRTAEPFNDIDLSRTVGWLTLRYPVRLALGERRSWDGKLKMVQDRLAKVADRGLGYQLLGLPLPIEVGFGYFGRALDALGQRGASNPFRPVPGPTGEPVDPRINRPYQLYITALLTGGSLVLTVEYARSLHRRDDIEGLGEAMRQSFEALRSSLEAGR
ncbi:amino acid adenylation domain-containing protein [Nonomuraea sp. NPDC026600]|uniref:amino acid adenylation domain-containing protein n=1 Tax=Nonomuraea sp. NPDC026600 TaxID=3155363 RepID=UPI00340790C3